MRLILRKYADDCQDGDNTDDDDNDDGDDNDSDDDDDEELTSDYWRHSTLFSSNKIK